jgi:hypothetical protein
MARSRAQICQAYGGWFDRGVWYFPSADMKNKALAAVKEAGYPLPFNQIRKP